MSDVRDHHTTIPSKEQHPDFGSNERAAGVAATQSTHPPVTYQERPAACNPTLATPSAMRSGWCHPLSSPGCHPAWGNPKIMLPGLGGQHRVPRRQGGHLIISRCS